MKPAKTQFVLFLRSSIFFLSGVNTTTSLRRRAWAPLPCGEGFKNMLFSDASTCCLWGLTCHDEKMDLGNGPATVWALSCRAEEPAEWIANRKGSRAPTDLRIGGGGGGGSIPPHVSLVLISLMLLLGHIQQCGNRVEVLLAVYKSPFFRQQ